ncbi:MAG TPA: M1 family metallopeptidase [Chitinophagaceae bacterium]|jgi:hypothetical protein|nr:M1 family metallopeptidase [Chitinophagaceae bacterium]
MKFLLSAFLLLSAAAASAQSGYWQQEVHYTIDVALDDNAHSLKGKMKLDYVNHSPDRLDFIWFHLWPNAYKNEKTAFARQLFRDPDGQKRWNEMQDKGYIDSLQFAVNGKPVKTEAHPEHIDVVKVLLPQPLAPGAKITLTTPFYVKLPTYSSRSGHDGQNYMVTQWYPKPAVYDRKGWHPMPYLDQGEFYSEFGTFRVNITVPSAYIVGATGTLQSADELRQYKTIGAANVAAQSRTNTVAYALPRTAAKTLSYTGEQIHDFAWFANKDFVIRYDTLQLGGGKTVDVFAYHHPDGNQNWVTSIDYIKSGTRFYSQAFGTYAYPTVAAVEGPKNDMSGGMEYPMITLITSPTATGEYLDAVITHEVGHNWLYGMLASNERTHAWMDEGINTYVQFRYEAEKYRANSVFGDMLPKELKKKNPEEFLEIIYSALKQVPMEAAIGTPSEDFKNKEEYGIVEYIKTSMWLYKLEQEVGRPTLEKALQAYFEQWKFRHPYPEDFRAVLEKETGKDLTAFFDLLNKKGRL